MIARLRLGNYILLEPMDEEGGQIRWPGRARDLPEWEMLIAQQLQGPLLAEATGYHCLGVDGSCDCCALLMCQEAVVSEAERGRCGFGLSGFHR